MISDVDECVDEDLNDCGEGFLCEDYAGSYQCLCLAGFVETGDSCIGRH